MPITQADIDSIKRGETIWGTTRFLPAWDTIPKCFVREMYGPNLYSKFIDAWYSGSPLPDVTVEFNSGFELDGKALKRFIMAHLNTFIPDHDHKIAGCAYLLSQVITIKE